MKKYTFDQVVEDCTSKFHKIKKEDYLPIGQYKIVDQGKELVAGYTNDTGLVNKLSSAIIVFGDHTRIFKYIDFPLALGADGVKALTVKNNLADSKYLYYYFKTLNLTDAGYSRHFKFLKEINIPLPENFEDQIRIATVLTRAEKLIAKRKESIKALDELLKSTFIEMFGDPVRNEKRWEIVSIKDLCSNIIDCPHNTPRYSDELTGLYCIRSADIQNGYLNLNNTLQVDVDTFKQRNSRHIPSYNDIVFTREGGRLGNSARVPRDLNICLGQRIMLFTADCNTATSEFLWASLNSSSLQQCINNLAGGGAAPRVNIKDLIKIKCCLPPLPLQNQFAAIVEKVETIKQRYTQSLIELENLYGSLSQRAFKGELDLSKVPVEKENEIKELQGEVEFTPPMDSKLSASKIYSEAELKRIIQSLEGEPFNFDALMTMLQKASFEEMPEYEELKKQLYKMLEGTNPLLSQSFDKVKKEIVLRVNL
ncbi:Type I restriction modification DNA specificity domain protein [anaerobic digester metagenome]